MLEQISGIRASFFYNGKRVELFPAEMEKTGSGVYEKTLEDGLTAILSAEKASENAETQLLRFENRGLQNSGTISCVKSFERVFSAPGDAFYESLTGDDCGSASFNPRIRTLKSGDSLAFEPRFGRPSDTTAFPFFDIGTSEGAATFGIGWSGQWRLELEKTASSLRVAAGLADVQTYLEPGESIRTASMIFLTAFDVPQARIQFRRLMLERFSPRDPETGGYVRLPVAETNFDRYFRKVPEWTTYDGQKRCADIAKKCGMDSLWLDAAWFKEGFPAGVGNWDYESCFSNGTGEIAEYAHSLGLRYIQWFEPERANAYSDTVRYFRDDVIILEGHNSVNCLVNIGDKRVYRRVTDEIKKHIRDDKLDVYRQDFNICPSGYWRTFDKPGRRGMTEISFVEALYNMWDEIKNEFPDVIIDNCASGGRRLDFETTRRSVPLWRSDTGCFEEDDKRRTTVWSQNQIIGLSRYLPYHSCGCWTASAYALRSTAAGGAVCNFDVYSPDFDAEKTAPLIEEVLRMREYWYGDFYPLTKAVNDEDVWAAWQLSLGNKGAVYAFRRRDCGRDTFSLSPAGIKENASYRVTVTDETLNKTETTLSGEELKSIKAFCPKPETSVIIEYKELDNTLN